MSLRDDLEALGLAGPYAELDADWWTAYNRLRAALSPAALIWLEALPGLLKLEKPAIKAPWAGEVFMGDESVGLFDNPCVYIELDEVKAGPNAISVLFEADWGSGEDAALIAALRNALHAAAKAQEEPNE